jgi:hypothetical protein
MAFTPADLEAIDRAIASGELTIRSADGKMVTMRSMSELLEARSVVVTGIASGTNKPRAYPRHQLADFSD